MAYSSLKRKTPLRSGKRLNKVSKSPKKVARQKEYQVVRNDYLSAHPTCEFASNGEKCRSKSCDIHHKIGREGDALTDADYFMAVCRAHHDWLHGNVAEARELGFTIYGAERFQR
jgi:hypothetical protein